jgi:hypothetical protein
MMRYIMGPFSKDLSVRTPVVHGPTLQKIMEHASDEEGATDNKLA